MFIILVPLLFPVITEGNRKEIILNDLAPLNYNSSVKLTFRVTFFPMFSCMTAFYLACKYSSFDLLIQH